MIKCWHFVRALFLNALSEWRESRRKYDWQYGSTFGGTVRIGRCTEREALRFVREVTNQPVIYVDKGKLGGVPYGFIAIRDVEKETDK